MLSIQILIVEDEPLYASQLEILVEELGYRVAGLASNAKDALELTFATKPDLLLMDIHLQGDKDGIEIAQSIHNRIGIPVIFITSMKDDATFERAKSIRPFAFITKPFKAKKLQRSIELAVSRLDLASQLPPLQWNKDILSKDFFFIKVKNRLEKIKLPEVLWIEVMNRDCSIHTQRRTIALRISLAELAEKLPAADFFQCHRSYIVNLQHIDSVDLVAQHILMGEHKIPFSKSNRDLLLKRLA